MPSEIVTHFTFSIFNYVIFFLHFQEYITKEIVIRTERLKKTGKLKSKFSSSNPEMSPSKEIHEKISADDIQLEIHKEVP